MKKYLFLLLLIVFYDCSQDDDNPQNSSSEMYFPPNNTTDWEALTPESLGWNTANLQPLYDYLQNGNTRAFIILKNGRIVVEKYFGNNITNTAPFDKNSYWYWASAGKTITSLLVGITQQEGLLNINNTTASYIGSGWSSLPANKENLILVKHQITMTTGLDDGVTDNHCTEPNCLQYKADAGTRWAYHNAAYTLLDKVLQNATGKTLNQLTDTKIEQTTGINGTWFTSGYDNVYYSTARDMARFGLLILNKGKWNTTSILSDANYYNAMVNTSQNLNLSYGYLWWLNGKPSAMFPDSQVVFPTSIAPNAPNDLIAALGKNGQFVDVIQSKNLVVIRMGDNPDNVDVPITFHNEMWQKIMNVIN